MNHCFIGVEAKNADKQSAILEEFRRNAERVFSGAGVECRRIKDQLLLDCPSLDVREKVREFINSYPDVREPAGPEPIYF